MCEAIGIIETVGYIGALNAIDMMMKMSYIEILKIERIGDGMVCIILKGDVESVKEALKVGEEVLYSFGGVVASRIIGKPSVTV